MTINMAVAIAAIGSAILVGVARLLMPFEFAVADLILFPGSIAELLRIGGVHGRGGFHGLSSEITVEGVSFLAWFVVLLVIIGLWRLAVNCIRE